jgi:hypothetical protein
MDPRDNIEHITQEYKAFCEGDFDAMGRMLAEEVIWHVGGRRQQSGDKLGREGALQFLRRLSTETHQNFRIQIHDVLANEEHIVVLCHVTSTMNDEVYRADEVHVFRVDPAGRITEAWGFTAESGGQGAFWF